MRASGRTVSSQYLNEPQNTYTLIVVCQHPCHTFDIGLGNPVKRVSTQGFMDEWGNAPLSEFLVAVLSAELLSIIALLITWFPKPVAALVN